MSFALIGFAVVLVACLGAWLGFARLGKQPARLLADGSGHVMIHSILDKGIALVFVAAFVCGFVAGMYRSWQIGSWGAALFVLALSVPIGWVCTLYERKQYNTVVLTATGMTWRRGSMAASIHWTEVADFSEAPSSTAWIVRARDGRTLRVDKLLIGTPTTFLDYLRAHVSASLYDTAFSYIRPMAAQRVREERRVAQDCKAPPARP